MIPENPIETMHVYAAQSQYLKGPDDIAQEAGMIPLDTLPADWWNWLWQEITKRINEASQAVESIHNEILSVLQAASITPSEVSTTDLLNAIKAITRTIGSEDIAGAVKSSTKSGYVAIDSDGYMSPNGMGIPTTLNTTAKQIVGAINEVLASLNTYKTSTNDSITGLTNSKAPNNHASSDTTYGTGSETNYGHVKLNDDTNRALGVASGTAATPAAVKAVSDSLASSVTSLQSSIDGRAPKMHASTTPIYGVSTDTQWGHVKLSDSTSSTSGASGGIAATPAAVKAVSDSLASNVSTLTSAIDGKAPTSHASSDTTYGIGSVTNYGHVKLSGSLNDPSDATTGTAATPAAVKALNDSLEDNVSTLTRAIGDKAPKLHNSSDTTYGVGSETQYGHVKLLDAVDSSSSRLDGVAATPWSVKAVNDALLQEAQTLWSKVNSKVGINDLATSTSNGLMTSTDKSKLDGIPTPAEGSNYLTGYVSGTSLYITIG